MHGEIQMLQAAVLEAERILQISITETLEASVAFNEVEQGDDELELLGAAADALGDAANALVVCRRKLRVAVDATVNR